MRLSGRCVEAFRSWRAVGGSDWGLGGSRQAGEHVDGRAGGRRARDP